MKQRVNGLSYVGKDGQLHTVRLCIIHQLRLRERHAIVTLFPSRVGRCTWCDSKKDLQLEEICH